VRSRTFSIAAAAAVVVVDVKEELRRVVRLKYTFELPFVSVLVLLAVFVFA
jgi:hypothetical protein